MLIAATGVLSLPFYPEVPGRETFRGEAYHTGLWPRTPVDFVGKRVAVIGTGSSGVQVIAAIADEVASLTVYQRTANWSTPLNNRPITPEEQAQLRADFESIRHTLNTSASGFLHEPCDRSSADDTKDERWAFYEEMWNSPGFTKMTSNYPDLLTDKDVNAEWCEFLAGKIRDIVEDPATAAKLIPDHLYGQRRPPFGTNYYETYNNPKVSLVDLKATPITAGHQARHRDRRRRAGVRHHRVGDRLRLRHRCPQPDGHPRPRRPRARGVLGRRAEHVSSGWPAAGSRTSSSPAGRTVRPATTRVTPATRSTS